MNFLNPTLKKMSLLFSLIFLATACSKDADLLSDYVIAKNGDLESIALLVDDQFFIGNGQQSILMDVLNNDNFGSDVQVSIVETSTPTNGEVVINADNTLTYTPQTVVTPPEETPTTDETSTTEEPSTNQETTETPVEDTFTYTTEVTTPDNEVSRQEATVTISPMEMGELLAFPGAKGFGKYTTGGRGGQVLHVTNLNDSGPGSLRDALSKTGPRTIVFNVGGNINLQSTLELGSTYQNININREDVTIAGETAPFPGITLIGANFDIYTSNVILRYISIRTNHDSSGDDALRIRNWGSGGYVQSNIIIDHISISHADDENLSMTGANNTSVLKNVTFQNSMLGKPKSAYNFLIGAFVSNISVYQNYFSHAPSRNPLVGYGDHGEAVEIINNIIYGYEGAGLFTYGSNVDLIGNVYKSFINNLPNYNTNDSHANASNNIASNGSIFYKDNFQLNPIQHALYSPSLVNRAGSNSNRVLGNSFITTWANTISQVENNVFPKVGNSLFRDELDNQLINDYFGNKGDFSLAPIPSKQINNRPSNYDTDLDGMADDWERSVFGDLSKTAQGDDDGDGYTNLETFLFYLTNN